MEIEVLSASLILVASLCGGLCAVFIARTKSTVNKHSRQRIKDFESDIVFSVLGDKASVKPQPRQHKTAREWSKFQGHLT